MVNAIDHAIGEGLATLEKVDVILPNAGMTSAGPQVLMVPVERQTFGIAHIVGGRIQE